ncbi:MAG: GFA family protein [Pseudohongiellaceae bacterium]
MNKTSRSGKCLCGNVTLVMESNSNSVEACHCSMCRAWGGGPLLSFESCKNIEIKGQDSVSVYQSSDWAERAFCKSCGSHLYYKITATGDHMVPPGLIENREELVLTTEVFIDEKPDFYSFSGNTNKLTGTEVIEAFKSQQEEPD